MASSKYRKRPLACRYCREKKVKCDGGSPCNYCEKHGEECVYPLPQTRRKPSAREKVLEERLAKLEALLEMSNNSPPINVHHGDYPSSSQAAQTHSSPILPLPQAMQLPLKAPTPRNTAEIPRNPLSPPAILRNAAFPASPIIDPYPEETQYPMITTAFSHSQAMQLENQAPYLLSPITTGRPPNSLVYPRSSSWQPALSPSHPDLDTARGDLAEEDGGFIEDNSTCEYHGAGSILSICSKPGSQWVSERIGSADFRRMTSRLATDVTHSLKLNRRIQLEQVPEPDWELAWELAQAYFCEYETVFGFVSRQSFETDLHAFFNPNVKTVNDPASYALRQVVYAGGKRSILKNNPHTTFAEIHAQSWPYFENALSVHTDLLYSKSTLTAVEALMAMAVYVEAIGCPCLEYMLCSNAARLAQSKGLHRQPPASWNLSEPEIQQRTWLFWAIYCYDKHISCRSGRPSAIDDNTISCKIPSFAPSKSNLNVAWCENAIELSKIQSEVMKFNNTSNISQTSPNNILQTVSQLNARILEWKKRVPHPFQVDEMINPSKLPSHVHIYSVLLLRYHYYGTLVTLNSPFVYPWITAKRENDQLLQGQVQRSTDLVVEASREIIKNTKYATIDYACPVWLSYYYPLVGLINLFIHVLRYPTLSSAQMDLALIDIATGHFAQLGYASSSSISLSFAREVAYLAHKAVEAAASGPGYNSPDTTGFTGITRHQNHKIGHHHNYPQVPREEWNLASELMNEISSADFMDTELNWGSLLPIPNPTFHDRSATSDAM